MKIKIYTLLLCLIGIKAFATHIIGGEITYNHLTGNDYQINLTVYRDCYNGIPPFDNPAFVKIVDSNGNVVTTIQMQLVSSSTMTLVNYTSNCVMTPTDICVEQGIYNNTVNLPPITGGYTIAYQRCCRNGTVLNIFNPAGTGATYLTHIPGSEVVAINSSPEFINTPPFYFCNNTDNTYEHFATDSDGDSLVYFLASPLDGLDNNCPMIDVSNASCPQASATPVYQNVIYTSPFNANYPISSSPAISINSSYGLITLTPNLCGDFAVSVGVNEYRNHVLIGTYYREFHVKVVNCSECTKIDELAELSFKVFPNPVKNSVTINLNSDLLFSFYEVMDISGNSILNGKIESISEQISVMKLSKGLYFLKIISKNGKQSKTEKLIIE